jgi:5-(aminomethyl)-3-furanmethanol phosphate kinase
MKVHFRGPSMWVVKVGGSLLGSPELERWLEIFVKFSDGKIIIVPGGGVFADAVREAQKISNISDAAAHKLALLAMDQYGHLLHSINPHLATAASELEIDERTWQHRAIVWLPSQMVLAEDSIPQNWDTTSDSIAAWLAQKMDATHLILLKSDRPENQKLSLKAISEDGLVDFAFQNFVNNQPFSTWVVKKGDYAHFNEGTCGFCEDVYGKKLKEFAALVTQ